MKKPAQVFSTPGFLALIFMLAWILFNWPLLEAGVSTSIFGASLYIFLAWAGIIAVLFLVARSTDKRLDQNGNNGKE